MDTLDSLRLDHTKKSNPKKGNRGKMIIPISILALIVLLGSVFIFSNTNGNIDENEIETATAFFQQDPNPIILISGGYVENSKEVTVSSEAEGILASLYVDEGDHVEKNQIIGQIDDSKLQANYNIADSRSHKTYEAKAETELAKLKLEDTTITAPISGIIQKKHIEEGEWISAGSAIVTISDHANLRVRSDINDVDIEKISVGQTVEIRPDASTSRVYHGYIARIQPVADRSKNTIQIKANISDVDDFLRPEMRVKLSILNDGSNEGPKLFVPTNSVLEEEGDYFVFIRKDDKFTKTKIEIDGSAGEYTIVLHGLSGGDIVAVAGIDKLNEISA